MAHTPPSEIDGIPVESHDNPTTMHGEEWVTLLPEDHSDERLWEFSLTTGRLLLMQEG